ncbi:hypothetical protein [Cryptobacterium curtum]
MKTREEIADSSHGANLPPCVGKAHYLGAEYSNTTTDRDMWPQSVTLEDEGSIATDNWHTMEYIRADLIDPTCHYLPDEIAVWFDDDDIEHEDVTLMDFDGDAASCDVCGYMMMAGDNGWFEMERLEHGYKLTPTFDFCPYCGARVVSSDE